MLDTDTKRRIDTARDILVGKVPDPKSQVEQITIALIYKFMDDMDAESEEFGGKRKFFANEFARYGWVKLMRSGLGGHEILNLYAEAITTMPQNPGIPLLFRNIFKNAYLPYRDPETLKMFLKVIDEFNYDHSERLGDAFEYLLSVLGSQGDAGQFRTPRHIIDFMVEVIDPKKTETVLDPACGTAGFLISSYKHILKNNSELQITNDAVSSEQFVIRNSQFVINLTPDEKGRLAKNFKGYDISPDMVRLSLVNLYLHGFADPHIYEYDTLSSQERWNDYADVILANPPFMSPKGGIKPHNRFSVQSKRSEVLFVDYMAEHLRANGRAGIIVPEGIIFQSQTAYKQLRKLLVEEYLVAVVSLPAGVFNPYSGVKTSILILDKSLAKKTDTIAFFKVENDGFGLGAQRREIAKNDLPETARRLKEWMNHGIHGTHGMPEKDISKSPSVYSVCSVVTSSKSSASAMCSVVGNGLIVPKEKIAANGDYNLSGERYRESGQKSSQYPHVELGEAVEILDSLRRPITKSDRKPGPYPYYGATGVLDYVEGYLFDEPLVLVGEDGAKWGAGENSAFPVEGKVWVNNHAHVLRPKRDRLLDRFLIEILNEADLMPYVTGVTVPKLNQEKLRSIPIPLPPLDAQKEIVAEIDGYQRIINGARTVLDNYRPHIHIHPDWPKRELGSLADNLDSRRVPITKGDRKEGPFPYYGASGIVDHVAGYIFDEDILLISEDGANLLARSTPIAFSVTGKCWVNNHAHVLKFENPATQKFVEVYLNTIPIEEFVTGAAQPKLNQQALNSILIPIPDDLTRQQVIMKEIEAEQALVAANRELIVRMEQKIQAVLARIWGEP
ncbi:MAG: N-6 DNA methylase [archaeon]